VYVLSGGQAGMYGGGGFFMPSESIKGGQPSGETFGASTRGATLYLTQATPGFEDALGPSGIAGSFQSKRDPQTAKAIQSVIRALEGAMEGVE
jgi:hypothetical protein